MTGSCGIISGMKRKAILVGAAAAVVVVGGVALSLGPEEDFPSASGPSASATTPPASPSPSATTEPASEAPAPADRCVDVSKGFGRAILDGANDAKLTLVDGAAVEHESGNYFVALRFLLDGEGDPLIGVWQTLNLETGPIRSVDGFAQEFTVWPDSGNNGSPIVDEARSCLPA